MMTRPRPASGWLALEVDRREDAVLMGTLLKPGSVPTALSLVGTDRLPGMSL